ncbi:hypothetical protein [Granulicella tundricola]|uniref:P-type conjugative transfer protein TrbJ n=1 Tax=Granulicella tundricola (strain ATCC BAA-1859 / DSM 23138 / MP5ACTX9) TaxID=1198114 RepID=E8X7F9_GRATM|nr:hypothetical protein [Granulicella tundricola]ADW71393.1 hypothetical protein AciX9_4447 [Granulicella tundricola MP5ACTX9]
MQTQRAYRTKLALGVIVFACVATPSFALFGIGDIVFDPTSYASLVSQLSTLQMQYNTVKNNLVHFSAKNQWHTALTALEHVNVANQFGETALFSVALNTNDPGSAKVAWGNATVPVNSSASVYLSSQPTNSAGKSQLAMIEASDASSPDCLNAVGAYRAARDTNLSSEQALQDDQLDEGDDTNAEVQQLNLLNAAQAQHLVELKAQGVLHACLAQQMAIQNMQQRNAAANDLNTWGFVQQQRQANNVNLTGGSQIWTTYLP